jgi:5-dehydro-2-deoxygluconokinase
VDRRDRRTIDVVERPEVITIGRVSVDLYPEQPGPMHGVTTLAKSIGGTATNVAVAVSRLGHHAAVVTKVGDDAFGLDVRTALETRFGVDTSFVSTHPTLPTPLAFAELDPVEEPNIIFYRYPDAPDFQMDDDDLAPVPIETAPIVWIPASRFAREPSRGAVSRALERRRRRTHTILDLDWRPHFWPDEPTATATLAPLIDQFTIVIGNREECRIATGATQPDDAADLLIGRGLDAAIVKLGGDGVLVATADGRRDRIPPVPVDVVCGLGAGDAFGGALCHGLLTGASVADAARLGNAAGAYVAQRLRCADDMPTLDQLTAFIDERAARNDQPGGTT